MVEVNRAVVSSSMKENTKGKRDLYQNLPEGVSLCLMNATNCSCDCISMASRRASLGNDLKQ